MSTDLFNSTHSLNRQAREAGLAALFGRTAFQHRFERFELRKLQMVLKMLWAKIRPLFVNERLVQFGTSCT